MSRRRIENRGRKEHDHYPTPDWCVEALLNDWEPDPIAGHWFEPAVGEGNIIHVVEKMLPCPERKWSAADLRDVTLRDSVAGIQFEDGVTRECDFITQFPSYYEYDVIITNPPYSLALEFVQKSIKMAGTVAMLLRLAFMSSLERQSFHREFPADIYVLPRRPSFTGDGKSDVGEYAWFVWDRRSVGGKWSVLRDLGRPARIKRRVNLPNLSIDGAPATETGTERISKLAMKEAFENLPKFSPPIDQGYDDAALGEGGGDATESN